MNFAFFGLLLSGLTLVFSTPLDDYVNTDDGVFKWTDTNQTFETLLGNTAYVLNVTSQRWLDTSRAYGPNGDLWTHQVIVVVPKRIREQHMGLAYLTGGCNEHVSVPSKTDEDLLVIDYMAWTMGSIGVVVFQIPNCPIVYPDDPSLKRRTEDAVIAWAWHKFLQDQEPEWLPRLPMAKAAFKCMQAVEEFTQQRGIGSLDTWSVAGASKRGWTTWMVGSATCDKCPHISAIAPLVPIVPNLIQEMHRMWQAYGGWTFAFSDYTAVNLTRYIDDPNMTQLAAIVDPMNYGERLTRLPKLVVLSSDDEFMMMDWSNIWYDELTGEKHLYIVQDTEHSLATGVVELLPSLASFVGAVAKNKPRPSFQYSYDPQTGQLGVQIDKGFVPKSVRVWIAKTTQETRRDFRWVRLATDETERCKLPDIPLPKPVFGGNCIQPILWKATNLTGPPYSFTPPQDLVSAKGPWLGYYIEVVFPGETGLELTNFQFTTPGFTWPNTLPFPDCHGAACEGTLL